MPRLNNRGITQIFLIGILLVGLAVSLWGFKYARTILNPRANEFVDLSGNLPNGWLGMVDPDGDPLYGHPGIVTEKGFFIKIGLPSNWTYPESQTMKFIEEASAEEGTACQTNCKKCATTDRYGSTTYDTCVDDKGASNQDGSGMFCNTPKTGANKFRCYASGNNSCVSNPTGAYGYSCSDIPTNQPDHTKEVMNTNRCNTSCGECTKRYDYNLQEYTYDTCIDDKDQSNLDQPTSFCKNGAKKFRCYASENSQCESSPEKSYNYLCPEETGDSMELEIPGNYVLRKLTVENSDSDGSKGGHIPFSTDKNFNEYIEKAVWWEVNDLNANQPEAPRTIKVTLSDGKYEKVMTMTVTLRRSRTPWW